MIKGNFMWAVEQMKQGNKVRRKIFTNNYLHIKDNHIYHENNEELRAFIPFIEATDWEVVEEPNKTLWEELDGCRDEDDSRFAVKEALREFIKVMTDKLNLHSEFKREAERIFGKEMLEEE